MERGNKVQLYAGVILTYGKIAVELLSGLLFTPVLLRSLGQSQYGVYSLCISFLGYLTLFNAGANAAYIRFHVQTRAIDERRVDGLNGMFLKLFLVLAAVALCGGLLLSHFSPVLLGSKITPDEYQLVRKCLTILAFIAFADVLNSCFSSLVIANEKFIFGRLLNTLRAILWPALSLPLLSRGCDCSWIIVIQLLLSVTMLTANVSFCFCKLHTRFKFSAFDGALFRAVLHFIFFIVLQSIMDQLNWQVDKLILAHTSGAVQISVYSIGATFNTAFITIGTAISGVFIAEINRIVVAKDRERLDELFVRTARINMYMACLVMMGYLIFGRTFVQCWAGPEYADSFYVGGMLMFPVTFSLIVGIGQDIARAKNKHQLQIVINVAVCAVNALISIPLAMRWNALGSAAGTFVAEIVICWFVQSIYYRKVLELDMGRMFREIGRAALGLVAPAVLGLALLHFRVIRNSYRSIVAYGVLFIAVYCTSLWLFSMNESEKGIVRSFFRKLRRRA